MRLKKIDDNDGFCVKVPVGSGVSTGEWDSCTERAFRPRLIVCRCFCPKSEDVSSVAWDGEDARSCRAWGGFEVS